MASLHFFDAVVAKRKNRKVALKLHALEAARRFDELQWHAYANEARSLVPGAPVVQKKTRSIEPVMSRHPNLTARERDIAALVIKGYTNRVIADQLSIGERTVETHVTSILNRLGIRSRYQLPERLD